MQPGHLYDLGPPLAQLLPAEAIGLAVEANVLRRGEVVVKRKQLGHIADVGLHCFGLGRRVVAQHPSLTPGGLEQAQQHADRRRLARAVGP